MKTILVPVDFSATAVNAAKYAMQFAKQCGVSKLVLFNAYELPVLSDGGLAIPIISGSDEMRNSSTKKLQQLKDELKFDFPNIIVDIEIRNSFNTVVTGIKDAALEVNADFIVMGITGGSTIEEVLIGSNAVDLAKHSTMPVLIIPSSVGFKLIRNILFTCDLRDVCKTTPVKVFTDVLDATKSQLHLLHVEQNEEETNFEETGFESMEVNTLFGSYEPKYHVVTNANFIDGVNLFVEENDIDLLMAVPKKHSFVESLFHKSHTNMLAFHSHVPVLLVHEEC